jgi:hypothetical protein
MDDIEKDGSTLVLRLMAMVELLIFQRVRGASP